MPIDDERSGFHGEDSFGRSGYDGSCIGRERPDEAVGEETRKTLNCSHTLRYEECRRSKVKTGEWKLEEERESQGESGLGFFSLVVAIIDGIGSDGNRQAGISSWRLMGFQSVE